MRKLKCFFLGVSIFCSAHLVAQTITGVVLDAKTQNPIESASVYFDNTTIGTSTNANGYFEIESHEVKSDLIISFLGYQKVILSNYESNLSYKILLEESVDALDQVVITSFDGMSRSLKLEVFRAQFLGFSKYAKSCTILNEDDLILRYNAADKQLTAEARYPIIVKNRDLNYIVNFEIETFHINFNYANSVSEDFKIHSILYKGTSFYTSLDNDTAKNIKRNRLKAYKGSVLHFMRALSQKRLNEEGYTIASKGFVVKPENYIVVAQTDVTALYKVKLRAPLSVLYKNKFQSEIQVPNFQNNQKQVQQKDIPFKSGDTINAKLFLKTYKIPKKQNINFNVAFYIDSFGNYSPLEAFSFIGYMANLRIGDSLPLDYNLEGDM